jgi:hypothetical protein
LPDTYNEFVKLKLPVFIILRYYRPTTGEDEKQNLKHSCCQAAMLTVHTTGKAHSYNNSITYGHIIH